MKRKLLRASAIVVAVAAILGATCLVTGKCQGKATSIVEALTAAKPNIEVADSTPQETEITEGGIQWLTSLDEAKKQSKQTGKPIFVDFYAEWCPPCKMMDNQTYPDSKVVAESLDWVMVRIDTDKQQDVAVEYGVQALPTLAVLKDDGDPVIGTGGFLDAKGFVKFLRDGKKKM